MLFLKRMTGTLESEAADCVNIGARCRGGLPFYQSACSPRMSDLSRRHLSRLVIKGRDYEQLAINGANGAR
jgi:hypothetical protein